MKISAVISEFDPFHNGHKYLLDNLRENGVTHIASIMSGNFTQRGTPAAVNKRARVYQALSCGADLVIEIPVVWCLSPAEKYASAGAFLADAMGCIDTLSFASESGDIEELKNASELISQIDKTELLKNRISQGLTLAKSYSMAANDSKKSELSKIIDSPNNILAVEYIRALKKLNSNIVPYSIKRAQAEHDALSPGENVASASYIRSLIKKGADFSAYVPDKVFKSVLEETANSRCPADINLLNRAVLSKLRAASASDLANISDVTEGIENRVISALKDSVSIDELCGKIKTKRYTYSRIRRIILCFFLGITKDLLEFKIPYIRVLGANNRGLEILKRLKSTAKLPVVTRFADIKGLGSNALRIFNAERIASDLYGLATPSPIPCGAEQSYSMLKYNI